MIGAIIGDVVGSRFEFNNHRSKSFEFMNSECFMTDDSYMTVAVAKAIIDYHKGDDNLEKNAIKYMQKIGRRFPYCGFGGMFRKWIMTDNPKPYNSFGNGSAMRISPVGLYATSIDEAKELSRRITAVSHNHPEGIKGAECLAVSMVLARQGKSKKEIKEYVCKNYYNIDFTIDEIRETYKFNETCQQTVPQALQCFFEGKNFTDTIRNAVSIGGDTDTVACIAGAIAEAYYGVNAKLKDKLFRTISVGFESNSFVFDLYVIQNEFYKIVKERSEQK